MIFTWCRWCDTMMIINIMFMMMFMIMFMMLFTMKMMLMVMMLMMMMMGMIAGALPCLFAFPDLWAPPWREGGCEGEKLWYDPDHDHDHDHNDDNVEDDHNHDHDHDDHNDDNVDDDHYNGDYKFSLQIAFHTFPLPPAQSRRRFGAFWYFLHKGSHGVSRVLRRSKNVSF